MSPLAAPGVVALVAGLSLGLVLPMRAPAAESTVPMPAGGSRAAGDDSALDARIEARVGSMLREAVRAGRNSAAVLVFVRDGKVRIAEGFGFEDATRRAAVTPSDSRFMLSSISKILVAVAVARLQADGRIGDLRDPANRYLTTYRLPRAKGEEITVRELATHTAGIDEDLFGMAQPAPLPGIPQPADYRAHPPRIFMAPGTLAVYSGRGIDLLALVVADVAGTPYAEYVRNSILKPLGMNATLVDYPADGIPHEVRAFQPGSPGNQVAVQYRVPMSVPDGAALSTGDDMGRFLIALLDRGNAGSVITPAMQAQLFRPQFQVVPGGNAYGLVFEVTHVGSKVVAFHRGGLNGSICTLALVPADSTGLFECLTVMTPLRGSPSAPLTPEEVDAANFSALALEGEASAPPRSARWNAAWGRHIGEYIWTSRAHLGIARLSSLLHARMVKVERGSDGLRIDGIDGLQETLPGRFERPGLAETFTFYRIPGSDHEFLSRSLNATSFETPGLLESPRVMKPVLAGLLLVAASGVLWPLWPRKYAGRALPAGAILFAGCMLGGTAVMFGFHAFGARYVFGIEWPLVIIRVLGFATLPLAGVLAFGAWREWRQREPGVVLAPLHATLLAVSAGVGAAALVCTGVIGFEGF